jgi:hypothetical protein
MRNKNHYFFETEPNSLTEKLAVVYQKVFRTNFVEPGFVVLDFGTNITSMQLRECMVLLKNKLSEMHSERMGEKLMFQWIGRFNQQETTKFHLDNAADQSFLMLGYEPSKVKSKLFFADFVQFYQSININSKEYFEKYNPVYTDGEKLLEPYITEIEGFREDSYKIVLMNNSNSNKLDQTIGVFHKAEIIQKDLTLDRVINSMMLCSSPLDEIENFSEAQVLDFITTTHIS